MTASSTASSRFLLACLLLSSVWPVRLFAAEPAGRKSLIIRGRTTDQEGFPVTKVRVSATGGRRVFAVSDETGQYTLTIPLGTLAELKHGTLRFDVRADRRGWRLTLPGGDAQIGVELRVVTGEDQIARCVVRSNDARVAAATARVVGIEGEAVWPVSISFLGVQKDTPEPSFAPELSQTAQVALTESAPRPVTPPRPEPRPVATSEESGWDLRYSSVPGERAKQESGSGAAATDSLARVSREPEPAPRPSALAKPKKKTPAPAAQPGVPAGAEKTLTEARAGSSREATPATEAARRHREEALALARAEQRERERLGREELERAKQNRLALEGVTAGKKEAEASLERERPEHGARWKVSAAADTLSPPPIAKPQKIAGEKEPAPPLTPRVQTKKTARLVAPRDSVAQRPAKALPEPSAPRRQVVPVPGSTATRPTAGAPIIHPPPRGEGRARAAPLVIRGPGVRLEQTVVSTDSCQCRVEGTVEVNSDQPLPEPLRVAVGLQWYPAVSDTVELFMGSPRPFVLRSAPCGPERLRVTLLSRSRFMVTSREALAGFRCEGGPVKQFRVVLGKL